MSFSFLNSGLVFLGFLVLAVGLFLLQRLRVRYRPEIVETTLFWREALHEARARVLVKRFRHPWAYLLVLAILSLIWLSIAGPEFKGDRTRRHLVLLDGSVDMEDKGRFDAAVEMALNELASLPSDARRVVLCAAEPRTLLRAGENPLLLRARLDDFRPRPSSLDADQVVRSFLAEDPGTPVSLILVGDLALDGSLLKRLPEQSTWRRLQPPRMTQPPGLRTLGQGPASSGRIERVDLLVSVAGPLERRAEFEVRLGEEALAVVPVRVDGEACTDFRYRDLPATGQVVSLVWPDGRRDGLMLADQRPVLVRLEDGLPPAIAQVLAADPGLEVVESGAQVVVRSGVEAVASDLPSFELGRRDQDLEAFFLQHDDRHDSEDSIHALVDELGLTSLDGPALAASVGATLRIGAAPGRRRGIRVWSELFEEERGFVRTAEFPIFLGRSLRWLAGQRPVPERVAVGEDLADLGARRGPDGRLVSSLGDHFLPELSGAYTDLDGGVVLASRQERSQSDLGVTIPRTEKSAEVGLSALELALLLVLALLVLEWFLVRLGRMP